VVNTAVILRGGLGNQLFQFACARNTQINLHSNLSVNDTIGFLLDRKYGRRFELNGLIQSDLVGCPTPFTRLLICEKISQRISNKLGLNLTKYLGYQLIQEHHDSFVDIKNSASSKRIFLSGYWQSHLYFKENLNQIAQEIADWVATSSSQTRKFSFNDSQDHQSVAVGIRTYSESQNPDFHARNGVQKKIVDWQIAIDKVMSRLEKPVFYIFTTDKEDIIKNLDFHHAKRILVNQDLIKSSKGRMLAFASCRNHIFNNSSFYWWGTFLSPYIFHREPGLVLASDNFLNVNSHLSSWENF
jgi:hypothetical protein